MLQKNKFMEQAIENAKMAFEIDEVPIGAVVVLDNKIIGSSYNQVLKNKNPTHHAEILAINQACSNINNHILNNCTIYSTIEPCPMCAGAILNSRIKNLYFGAEDVKYGAIHNKAKIFSHQYPHILNVYGGLQEKECKELMQKFFKEKRLLKHYQ